LTITNTKYKYKHATDLKSQAIIIWKMQLFKDKIIEHMKKPSAQIIEGRLKY
jgi:hypothetical protein